MLSSQHAGDQDPVIAVTADSHVGPLLVEQLRPYCPAAHLDDYDAFIARNALNAPFRNYDPNDPRANHPASDEGTRLVTELAKTEGHYDMGVRLADMDRDGVAAEVIFHGSQNAQLFPFIDSITGAAFFNPTGEHLELVGVGMHMYNQWLADVCSIQPERHVGLAHLPMWDIDAAIAELKWARQAGLRGVNFPAPRPGVANYDDPEWEPFWAACEDLQMPLTTHAGAGDPTSMSGRQRILILVMEAGGWLCRRALHRMVFAGVFERHPGLKLVYTELTEDPSDWWGPTLREFDKFYSRGGWMLGDQLSKLPSEYVRSNVYIGNSLMHRSESNEAELAIEGGYAANMMWGSDYPHIEGTFSYSEAGDDESTTRLALRHSFAGTSIDTVRKIAGETAIELYGLDQAALAAVAKRINAPLPSEFASAPLNVPEHWVSASVTSL